MISLLFKVKQDCAWCTPLHNTKTLHRHSLISKCHTISQYRHKCIFNNGHKKSMGFPTMISMNSTCCSNLLHDNSSKLDTRCGNCRQNFIYCTYFHKTHSLTLHGNSLFQISNKSVKKYGQFMPLTKVWLALSQHPKTSYLLTTFCNDLHHSIVKKIWQIAQQVELDHGWTDAVFTKHSFSLLYNECLKTTNVCSAASCFYVPNLYSFLC